MSTRWTYSLRLASIAVLAVLLASCGRKAPAPATPASVASAKPPNLAETHHPAGIDWFGGFPFEVAGFEVLIAYLEARGFSMISAKRNTSHGCSEFAAQLQKAS